MPLKTGKWDLNVNGSKGTLEITPLNDGGGLDVMVQFDAYGGPPEFMGMWDEVGGRLTFIRGVGSPLFFEGHLIRTPMNPAVGQDLLWTLVGTVDLPRDIPMLKLWGGSKRRTRFGWLAQVTEVA
jgi:hypothetical protein